MGQSIYRNLFLTVSLRWLKLIACHLVELLKSAANKIKYRHYLNRARGELLGVPYWQLQDIGLSRADVVFGVFTSSECTLKMLDNQVCYRVEKNKI